MGTKAKEAVKVDRRIIAVLVVAVLAITMVAVSVASEPDAEDEGFTIKQHLDVGDYIKQSCSMDGQTKMIEYRITAFDRETGLYTVECRDAFPVLDADGVTIKNVFEIKQMTGQKFIEQAAESADSIKFETEASVAQMGWGGIEFSKIGQETVPTTVYGNMRCSIYEAVYGDSDTSYRALYWLGVNDMFVKEVMHIQYAGNEYVCTEEMLESNIVVKEGGSSIGFVIDDDFQVGDSMVRDLDSNGIKDHYSWDIVECDMSKGEYTVELRQTSIHYNEETGEFEPQVKTDTEVWTFQKLMDNIAPTEEYLRYSLQTKAESEGIDFEFSKVGQEFVYTNNYGTMRCDKFVGTYFIPEIQTSVKYIYWTGPENILVKSQMIFNDEFVGTSLLKACTNIVQEDMDVVGVHVREGFEVGDYFWVKDRIITSEMWHYKQNVDSFYNLHFKYDMEGMEYLCSMYYVLEGQPIYCDVYERDDGVTVCLAKDSGVQLYFEIPEEGKITFVKTAACSADLSESFTVEDIEAGLTFQKTTTHFADTFIKGENQHRVVGVTNYYYKVVSVIDDEVRFTVDYEDYYFQVYKNCIASIDGDTITTELGSVWDAKEFADSISASAIVEYEREEYDVISEEHSKGYIMSDFGKMEKDIVTLISTYGDDHITDIISYIGEDMFMSRHYECIGDYYREVQDEMIFDSNLIIFDTDE